MPEVASRKPSTLSQVVYLAVAFLAFFFLVTLAYVVFLLFSGSRKQPVGILHLTPLEEQTSF